jgi:DNA invertase Pin-like site-specific DNA recombinase
MKVFGVLRVSKGATNGASLKVQRETIEAAADREGWSVEWVEEIVTGSGKRARPQLDAALEALDRGEAAALVVSKIDRLSRSIIAFARMLERSRSKGWKIVALDMGVDFDTPQGKLLGNQLISFAEYEREIIAARTKDALRVKRAEGVRLGGPRSENVSAATVRRMKRQRSGGWTFQRIADKLNADGVPTARGGSEWRPSSVRAILGRVDQRRRYPVAA